ncbi:MAG: peptidylprolyl isomerase [Desulfovibrionaceae bacterium]|nr:peptidylprolyl isomerase [Desulfovibrionaceae bacterium]
MSRRCFTFHCLVLAACLAAALVFGADPARAAGDRVLVKLETTKGVIVLELFPDKAPKTVANFLGHVRRGYYNGTIFHRVINGFMIQGGGFDANMARRAEGGTVVNEADNGLTNDVYTVAMARTSDPNSAAAQFFINVKDNPFLNHRSKTPSEWGYCVFGKVFSGKRVVDAIKGVRTTSRGPYKDVPVDPVTIVRAEVLDQAP